MQQTSLEALGLPAEIYKVFQENTIEISLIYQTKWSSQLANLLNLLTDDPGMKNEWDLEALFLALFSSKIETLTAQPSFVYNNPSPQLKLIRDAFNYNISLTYKALINNPVNWVNLWREILCEARDYRKELNSLEEIWSAMRDQWFRFPETTSLLHQAYFINPYMCPELTKVLEENLKYFPRGKEILLRYYGIGRHELPVQTQTEQEIAEHLNIEDIEVNELRIMALTQVAQAVRLQNYLYYDPEIVLCLLDQSLDKIGIPASVSSKLAPYDIKTIRDLLERTVSDLKEIYGIGPQSLDIIMSALKNHHWSLPW